MKFSLSKSSAALAALLLTAAGTIFASDPFDPPPAPDSIFTALEAELHRSMSRLRDESFGPPYFLAYRLVDARHYEISASLGSVMSDLLDHSRVAYVEARYGTVAVDNTDIGYQGINSGTSLDPDALRQTYWVLTDQAYKGALSGWLEKKARRATELITDPLDDFSPLRAARESHDVEWKPFDQDGMRSLAVDLSAIFKTYADIYDSNVTVIDWWARRFLVTSEGTRLLTPTSSMPDEVRVSAAARADDGMRLESYMTIPTTEIENFPPRAELERRVRKLAEDLTALRAAPAQEAADAPAILDPEAAGVIFHEALGHKLEGQRQRDPNASQVYRDLIGKRILPDFISVIDDPTMKNFKGQELHGSYDFDSEGAPAERAVLVDRGILRHYLMSRWPVKGFSRTNGHGRSDWWSHPSGRMANLIVKARGAVPVAKLEKRLMKILHEKNKPYGFLIVGALSGENSTTRDAPQTLELRPRFVYRIDAQTGQKTLVRGVKLVGTPLMVLNRIIAAGDDDTLDNGSFCNAESGWVPVSQIAPSLLLSEVELQRVAEDRQRPMILKSPLHDDR